jgi:hypothetical protein
LRPSSEPWTGTFPCLLSTPHEASLSALNPSQLCTNKDEFTTLVDLTILEDQMCVRSAADYDSANGSPDRMDALVWAIASLFDKMTGRRRKEVAKEEDTYKLLNTAFGQDNVYRGKSNTGWMAS